MAETPVPFGPRNCDQSSAGAVGDANITMNKATSVVFTFDICSRESADILLQQNPQIALITQIFETLDELGPTV